MSKRDARQVMQELANTIGNNIGKDNGFVLIVFNNKGEESRASYISNCDRTEVIPALEDFIKQTKGTWGTHKI